MVTIGNLIFTCWVIVYLYWIISSRFTKPTQEVKSRTGSVWWTVGMFLAVWLLKDFGQFLPDSQIIQLVALLLVVLGAIIALTARITLAGNWSKDVVFKKDHELITTGLYNYIRHPIYTGFLLMGLGSALYLRTLGIFAVFIIALIFLIYKFKQEEELMTKHFSKDYPSYKKRTKALIPFIY